MIHILWMEKLAVSYEIIQNVIQVADFLQKN